MSKLAQLHGKDVLVKAVKELSIIAKKLVLQYANDKDLMSNFQEWPEDFKQTICKTIKYRRPDILHAHISNIVLNIDNFLQYFDWNISLVLSSSSLQSTNKLVMNLVVVSKNNILHFQLSSEEVKKLSNILRKLAYDV